MLMAMAMFFTFDRHWILRADSRALAKTGKSMAARIPMIAITTSNSISVNPFHRSLITALSPPDADNSAAGHPHLSGPPSCFRLTSFGPFSLIGGSTHYSTPRRAIPVRRRRRKLCARAARPALSRNSSASQDAPAARIVIFSVITAAPVLGGAEDGEGFWSGRGCP
jgi:hypothetical protein